MWNLDLYVCSDVIVFHKHLMLMFAHSTFRALAKDLMPEAEDASDHNKNEVDNENFDS